jgi:tripeptide aminopeptidase
MRTDGAQPTKMGRALTLLLQDERVGRAVERIRATDEATLATQIELSEIAAPPFLEAARGERMAGLMTEAGRYDVRRDEVGNVLCTRSEVPPTRPAFVVSAHLDTVFPAGTDVRVKRDGNTLRGPGISDDARGLATLLALARALEECGIRTATPLLFAATVGEEGIGDLRGVKHLLVNGRGDLPVAGFVSLDGAGLERVVVRGLGSRRFRITASGPGGHSWVDWGTPNPIHRLSALAHDFTQMRLPADPVVTLTIARWGGGKSINAIPQHAWIELDTRSDDDTCLVELESEIRRLIDEASSAAPSGIVFDAETIGRRPAGATPIESDIVQAALVATRNQGVEPRLATSSTDANIPMSLGIPAVTLGCGGEAGKTHTTEEWYRNAQGVRGVVRAFYTILLVAGIEA